MTANGTTNLERLRAAVPVALVHLLLGLVLLRGLASAPPLPEQDALRLVDLPPEQEVPLEQPPPPPPAPGRATAERQADPRTAGAASPPNLEARPTPVVAPEPVVRLPTPPLPAAPITGTGFAPSAGAAPVRGPGTGSGGTGSGTGSGSGGDGAGGGGGGGGGGDGAGMAVTPPRQVAGRLSIGDMPEDLRESGFSGRVWVLYRVEADGRVSQCRVTRSSGSRLLDAATCRLIQQRFRFRPSRDDRGRPTWSMVEEFHEFESEVMPPEPPRGRRRGW